MAACVGLGRRMLTSSTAISLSSVRPWSPTDIRTQRSTYSPRPRRAGSNHSPPNFDMNAEAPARVAKQWILKICPLDVTDGMTLQRNRRLQ